MRVFIVGSGGREHALAWKISQSGRLSKLFVAPGNAGTARLAENVPLPAEGSGSAQALLEFARQNKVNLVVIGPEAPLAAGLADEFRAAAIPVFGPSRLAAEIEASKAFAKAFMGRHSIPTAPYEIFTGFEAACAYLRQVDHPVVIKACGLAAGKGVLVPETLDEAEAGLRAMLLEGEYGVAGGEVVIEERLEGEEISLLAFSDGYAVRPMPPAQDHKRLLDGDAGPNTGGMGAFAPAPACPPALVEEITGRVLQPAVAGLRAEGRPFVGVLYAGLILTRGGLRVLEFNCRFGDPETQAILPLLESDLLDVLEACVDGRLGELEVRWRPGAAACVVLAAANYPGKVSGGQVICGLDQALAGTMIFHAGTRLSGDQVVTAGGRVLGAAGWGSDIEQALQRAYAAAGQVAFAGMQYRRDIGRRAASEPAVPHSAYGRAGVDIDAGHRAVELMDAAVRLTYGPQVLAGIGSFGGLYDASTLQNLQSPVLVASTDGVGTKVKLAAQAGRYASIGVDLVNHCINDILVQGARPLFFLDYVASARLEPQIIAEIVTGIASACREAGCALLGGETAEMPDVYLPGEFDVAGTIVGSVERSRMLPRPTLCAGDVLVGLRSSGPHTNGYSLIRRIFAGVPLDTRYPELGVSLADALLAPHRSYLGLLQTEMNHPQSRIKALAHLTGGGLIENLPRVLPAGLAAAVRLGSWPVPPLFRLLQARGQVAETEMYRVFNMGIGMVAIVAAEETAALQANLSEETWLIGELILGARKVQLI